MFGTKKYALGFKSPFFFNLKGVIVFVFPIKFLKSLWRELCLSGHGFESVHSFSLGVLWLVAREF